MPSAWLHTPASRGAAEVELGPHVIAIGFSNQENIAPGQLLAAQCVTQGGTSGGQQAGRLGRGHQIGRVGTHQPAGQALEHRGRAQAGQPSSSGTSVSAGSSRASAGSSPSTVRKWELGDKKPSGPSLKLLNILERKGLQAVL